LLRRVLRVFRGESVAVKAMGCCGRKKEASIKKPVLVETPYTPDNECPWDAKPSGIFPMNNVSLF
jgi:hypothetical protein